MSRSSGIARYAVRPATRCLPHLGSSASSSTIRRRVFRANGWSAALAALCAVLTLASCSGTKKPDVGEAAASYREVPVATLPGWTADPANEILPALALSCERLGLIRPDAPVGPPVLGGRAADWGPACGEAQTLYRSGATAEETRRFLERRFRAWRVVEVGGGDGLFTGYYEGDLDVSPRKTSAYATPVLGLPDGWERSGPDRPDRAAIERGALDGVAPVLYWARDPIDLFMLQIQGSGVVRLPDGSTARIGYAGDNGHPFVGIGGLMRERGYGDGASMPAIRAWLRANPEKGAALMLENPRYIFFRRIEGDGPIGAQGVPLTARRSVAVDKEHTALGSLVWVSTTDGSGAPLRRLAVAQDTGGAIKGPARVDFCWGSGEHALYYAGSMRSAGQLWVLLPKGKL